MPYSLEINPQGAAPIVQVTDDEIASRCGRLDRDAIPREGAAPRRSPPPLHENIRLQASVSPYPERRNIDFDLPNWDGFQGGWSV